MLRHELESQKKLAKEHIGEQYDHIRNFTVYLMCSSKDMKSKLAMQRTEYEKTIKRHMSFIDSLISEKEELSKKCEHLTSDVKTLEKSFGEKV